MMTNHKRSILVTGGAGYIGSVLVRHLLNKGYQVRVLDNFLFGRQSLQSIRHHPRLDLCPGDIRSENDLKRSLKGIQDVVHLAALVGDPVCSVAGAEAVRVNFLATVKLARLAARSARGRFIFASTCSVYGQSQRVATERTTPFPISWYAATKLNAEKKLIGIFRRRPGLTILRLASAYGWSPRMRFDLVINAMVKNAAAGRTITIFGGDQWRPFIHVDDIAQAVWLMLHSDNRFIDRQVFNTGADSQNYRMRSVGTLLQRCFPGQKINRVKDLTDIRSYRVSFAKIARLGFCPNRSVADGIREVAAAMKNKPIVDPEKPIYYNDSYPLLIRRLHRPK